MGGIEEKGVVKGIVERVGEIYEESVSRVNVGGERD